MAYLRLDKDLRFDDDWQHEMKTISKGRADMKYVEKLCQEAQKTAMYVQGHGVDFNHHDDENMLLEFKRGQHLCFLRAAGRQSSIAWWGTLRSLQTVKCSGRRRGGIC